VARAPGATKIQLTNNSILFVPINFASDAPAQHFVINNPGTTPQQIDLPIPSGSNSVPLYFAIQNVGESTANGTQFTFACDPALKVQSDKGWTTIVREQQGTAPLPKVMGINLTAPLHQLDGNILPKIEFTPETNLLSPEALAFQSDGTNWQVSIRTVPPSPIQIPMEVEIKAEGADPTLLTFSAIFYLSNASKDPELASQPDTNTFLMIDPWNISGIHPAKTNLQN
jgi:hypothetical protein